MGKLISMAEYKRNEEHKSIEVGFTILHADDIYNHYMGQQMWYVKSLWWQYWGIWSSYVNDEEAWWECIEKLVQARHYVMGLTAVLKEFQRWDYDKCIPEDF